MVFNVPSECRNHMHPNPTIKRFSQSVTSANKSVTSAKLGSVSFADAVDYASVIPYSVVYGWLPSTMVEHAMAGNKSVHTLDTSQENLLTC